MVEEDTEQENTTASDCLNLVNVGHCRLSSIEHSSQTANFLRLAVQNDVNLRKIPLQACGLAPHQHYK